MGRRGTLTGTPLRGVSNPTFKQEWKDDQGAVGLDSLGNWRVFRQASDGSSFTGAGDLTQSRDYNAVNEPTGIDEQTDPQQAQWVDPTYDPAGNMASAPKPGRLAAGETRLFFQWDAWNRLSRVWQDDGDRETGPEVRTDRRPPATHSRPGAALRQGSGRRSPRPVPGGKSTRAACFSLAFSQPRR